MNINESASRIVDRPSVQRSWCRPARMVLFGLSLAIPAVATADGSPARAASPLAPAPGYSVADFSSVLRLERATERMVANHDVNIALDSFDTPLGLVHFRTPRTAPGDEVSRLKRSVVRAWSLAALAAEDLALPAPLPDRQLGWSVSLSEGNILTGKGGANDKAYCHSAWIGPPADIVIDGYRLTHPCDSSESVPLREKRLVRSLVHEVGHAIEFQMLGRGFSRRQRWHSEGFAVWFEMAALPLLEDTPRLLGPVQAPRVVLERSALNERVRSAFAQSSKSWQPMYFAGTPDDYARSYGMIAAIVRSGGVESLRRVYGLMDARHLSFEESVRGVLGWDLAEWTRRAAAVS